MSKPIRVRAVHYALVLGVLVVVAACKSRGAGAVKDSTKGTAGIPMGGMMMTNPAMMDSMQSEMGRMRGMSADQMAAEMEVHRQLTANMLAQMNADMRGMNMTGDPRWTALVDSVRQDLVQLPSVPRGQLETVMPGHLARVQRLMAMHRDMMSTMSGSNK
jgi:hypothetical protein